MKLSDPRFKVQGCDGYFNDNWRITQKPRNDWLGIPRRPNVRTDYWVRSTVVYLLGDRTKFVILTIVAIHRIRRCGSEALVGRELYLYCSRNISILNRLKNIVVLKASQLKESTTVHRSSTVRHTEGRSRSRGWCWSTIADHCIVAHPNLKPILYIAERR